MRKFNIIMDIVRLYGCLDLQRIMKKGYLLKEDKEFIKLILKKKKELKECS